jgi:hypothetical protein
MSASNTEKLPRYRPGLGFISVAPVLSWIAFGSALPDHAWDQMLYPGASLWPWLRPHDVERGLEKLSRGEDRRPPRKLLQTLQTSIRHAAFLAAQAAGARPSFGDFAKREVSADELKAAAVEWKAGFDAAKLRPDAVADALDGASSTLRRAAMRGEVAVFVEMTSFDFENEQNEQRAWIAGTAVQQSRTLRVCAARFEEPLFFSPDGFSPADHNLRFGAPPSRERALFRAVLDGSEVRERWPDPDPQRVWTAADGSTPLPSPPEQERAPRGAGGRPPHKARDAFIRELVRLANSPDGLPDPAALFRHMLQWGEDEFGDDAPSETTVRGWIAECVPGER